MFYGFKYTKAVTYDECINQIFGRKIGLFANIVVFIHVFGAVVSTWIFSYVFCSTSTQEIFGDFSHSAELLFKYVFFGVTLIIMFCSVSFANIDKLKFIAIVGFLILVYLVLLFMAYTPDYFNHYNKKGEFELEGIIATTFMFKVYGLTQYIFLNQYSIIPLCNNVKNVSFRRIKKVIFRAILSLFMIYFCVMITGYFSQPSISLAKTKLTELFILRPSISGKKEMPLLVGQTLFGITLFIANLVKSQFFIMYFHQIIKNTLILWRGGTKSELLQRRLARQEQKEAEESQKKDAIKKMKRSKSAGRCIKFNVPRRKLSKLKETTESKETSENEETPGKSPTDNQGFHINVHEVGDSEPGTPMQPLPKQRNTFDLGSQSKEEEGEEIKEQISFSNTNFDNADANDGAGNNLTEHLLKSPKPPSILRNPGKNPNVFKTDINSQEKEPTKKESAPPREPLDWKKIGINAVVMVVTFFLTLTLMNSLSTFLSLIGNFVGVFEIFVFPFVMMIILNRRKKIISNLHLVSFSSVPFVNRKPYKKPRLPMFPL